MTCSSALECELHGGMSIPSPVRRCQGQRTPRGWGCLGPSVSLWYDFHAEVFSFKASQAGLAMFVPKENGTSGAVGETQV